MIYLGYQGEDTVRKKALTNAQGVSVTGGATTGRMHVDVEKEGYYATRSGCLSRKQDHDVTYVLRQVKNPIPLYAKKFRGKVPGIGNKYGFDFEKGDWVKPHGKGVITDGGFKMLKNNC